jgi:hypothetical protein
MREDLELETLEERRLSLRLILMYKVVEGLVPALPTDNFVKLARPNVGTAVSCSSVIQVLLYYCMYVSLLYSMLYDL